MEVFFWYMPEMALPEKPLVNDPFFEDFVNFYAHEYACYAMDHQKSPKMSF
jgi:hypothetical protein